MSKYPFLKIFLAFLFVPMWGGLGMGLIVLFLSPISETGGLLWDVWFQLAILLFMMMFSLVFEVIPAAVLGGVYVWLRLKRGVLSYVFVFVCGGVTAYIWTHYVFGFGGRYSFEKFEYLRPMILQNIRSKAFVMGSIFSVLTAMIVLPSPEKK